jgi:hypothetical protein
VRREPPRSTTPESFLAGHEQAGRLYDAVLHALRDLTGVAVRVGKSQITFSRRRSFAAVWVPGRYLRGRTAPLVLTVYLPDRDPSPRWKQVVEPARGRFTHHLELWQESDVDDEVVRWLRRAWGGAG